MPLIRLDRDAHVTTLPLREASWSPLFTDQPGNEDPIEITILEEIGGLPPQTTPEQAAAALAESKLDVALSSAAPSFGLVTMRPYQIEAIDAVANCWSRGKKSPLVVIPTGTGKTLVAAEIIRRFMDANPGERAVFMAHRRELLKQTANKIKTVAPRITLGMVQGKHNETHRRAVIGSTQTLGHANGDRLKEVLSHGKIGLLVVDECHHAVAAQPRRIIQSLREANKDLLLLGLTATPGREDGTGLDLVFDAIAYERNLFQMIQDGWLVPPSIIRVELDISFDDVESRDGDYVEASLGKVMNKPSVNRAVVRAWGERGQDRKMLVFAVDVAHAHALAEAFNEEGFPAVAIDGATKEKERERALEQFRTGDIKLLVSCEVLTEGYDEPSAEGIIWARPTQSQALAIQMIGRGLRLHPGKVDCLVLDLVGNSEKHAPVQLATLVGLDPLRAGRSSGGDNEGEEEDEEADEREVSVAGMSARDVDFHGIVRRQQLRYQWRETPAGWILNVPRVGYLLVAFHRGDRSRATIRFHDSRSEKKHSPPQDMTTAPVEFEMAYGLAEGFVERILRAKNSMGRLKDDDASPSDAMPWNSILDLDEEGVDADVAALAERALDPDAEWRGRRPTEKQLLLLHRLGVKDKDVPATSGEAADLITILEVERDMNMRLPATNKQLFYLRRNKISYDKDITKGQARKLIIEHRAKEAKRGAS